MEVSGLVAGLRNTCPLLHMCVLRDISGHSLAHLGDRLLVAEQKVEYEPPSRPLPSFSCPLVRTPRADEIKIEAEQENFPEHVCYSGVLETERHHLQQLSQGRHHQIFFPIGLRGTTE